ncbi:MAG TPA: efflux transporter outer membrane subunit [Phycisphaerales bacterium]|nr:efflux transporter outer membrane subunit [Phycisphaerales bacterium]
MRSINRLSRPLALLLSAGAAAALTACKAVGPDYAEPQLTAPDAWATSDLPGAPGSGTPADLSRWWTTLNDSMLTSLMDRAVEGNLDLRVATARIREARAARAFAYAANSPVLDLNAGATRTRNSPNSGSGVGTDGSGRGLFTAGLDASWEIDVFGGIRRSVEAADADIGSVVWDRRALTVSLLAEVALNYMDLRTAQQRIVATRGNVDTQSKTVDLATNRFTTGLDSEIDSTRARSQRAATQSLIPALEAQARQAIYRLSVLLGRHPGALVAELEPVGPIPQGVATPNLPIGVPTDLIRRRADLHRAERDLAAATARIGVATADLYPRFNLGGSIGVSSRVFGNLPEGDSTFWSAGPGVNWRLFDGGAIQASIGGAEARTEQAAIIYRGTLLTALNEVDSAAVAFVKNQERAAALSEAVTAQQRAVELANQLFSKQLTNFLTVLDSQRRLFELQDQLVASQGDVGTSLVSLYKALGGGWEGIDAALDGPPPQADATPAPQAAP